MIERFGLAFVCLGLVAANAVAATPVEFRGEFVITAQNQTCTDLEGDIVGLTLKMRFSPPKLGANDVTTSLSVFYDFGGAENYRLPSGNIVGTTFKPVTYSNIFRYANSNPAGSPDAAKMRFTSQKPAVLTTETTDVRIKGDIKSFSDVGCDISFSATGFKP